MVSVTFGLISQFLTITPYNNTDFALRQVWLKRRVTPEESIVELNCSGVNGRR